MDKELPLYFGSPIKRSKMSSELLEKTNNLCEPYVKEARALTEYAIKERNKLYNKDLKDFAMSYHSKSLAEDSDLKYLKDYIIDESFKFADESGFNIKNHNVFFKEFWVQEFASKGGHHMPHIHSNNHVCGFLFLKCSENTSKPVFHDPRPGAMMSRLPEKDPDQITPASYAFHFKPKPGQFIIFPAYLLHEFTVDYGIDPFRFIHWNIQFIPRHA
tara:strand:+ start:1855 stop:2502 length:648 start_codon:yes stop_codon:yes gene_type:complete